MMITIEIRSRLSQNPAKDSVREIRCNEVKEGEVTVRVDSLNKRDANTMVTNYYQVTLTVMTQQ